MIFLWVQLSYWCLFSCSYHLEEKLFRINEGAVFLLFRGFVLLVMPDFAMQRSEYFQTIWLKWILLLLISRWILSLPEYKLIENAYISEAKIVICLLKYVAKSVCLQSLEPEVCFMKPFAYCRSDVIMTSTIHSHSQSFDTNCSVWIKAPYTNSYCFINPEQYVNNFKLLLSHQCGIWFWHFPHQRLIVILVHHLIQWSLILYSSCLKLVFPPLE